MTENPRARLLAATKMRTPQGGEDHARVAITHVCLGSCKRRPSGIGAGADLESAPQPDADRREPRRDDQECGLVQHLGRECGRPVHRAASAGDGHLLVHRSAARPRRRLDEFAGVRQADLQRRLHRNDGEAAPRHLLERRRRVHLGRCRLHRRVAHEDQRHALERSVPDQRRLGVGARPQHRRVQAEETEFALPCALHGALERGLDDAQARLREGRRSAEIRLQQAGLARPLRAAQLRPERQMVHLADARRLAAHDARPLRQAGPEIRRLRGPGPARQARDRADEPRARHHPRHVGGRHVHAGETVEDVARMVQGLPLCASRSDAAVRDLQRPEPVVQGSPRALGARPGDRHQGGVDGVLSRRCHHLGDRDPADRHAYRELPCRRWKPG